jgi:hypothetical protein
MDFRLETETSNTLDLVVNQVLPIITFWIADYQKSLAELPPFVLYTLYQTATIVVRKYNVSKSSTHKSQLQTVKLALKCISKRWKAGGKLLYSFISYTSTQLF